MNTFILAIILKTTNPVIPPTVTRQEFFTKQECITKLGEMVHSKDGYGSTEFGGKRWPNKLLYITCTEYKK